MKPPAALSAVSGRATARMPWSRVTAMTPDWPALTTLAAISGSLALICSRTMAPTKAEPAPSAGLVMADLAARAKAPAVFLSWPSWPRGTCGVTAGRAVGGEGGVQPVGRPALPAHVGALDAIADAEIALGDQHAEGRWGRRGGRDDDGRRLGSRHAVQKDAYAADPGQGGDAEDGHAGRVHACPSPRGRPGPCPRPRQSCWCFDSIMAASG